MSLDLLPDLLNRLANLQSSVDEIGARVTALCEHQAKPPAPPAPSAPRQFFSVKEVAKMLGRTSFCVREWCRHGRINAVKRAERRGGTALWSIAAEEIDRYRDGGLLPIDPERNNLN